MSPAQTVLDRAAIEARLPHREPFLFLDRFEAAAGAASGAGAPHAVASWRVPEDADFFRGHYPGNPVTPGVILCEHAFQAAAVLLTELGESFGAARAVPVLARIERAKFRRMVRPGDTLRTEVQLADRAGPAAYLEAKVWVGDELAMEVRCVLAKSGGAT